VETFDPQSVPVVEADDQEQVIDDIDPDASGEARLNLPMWAMVTLGVMIGVAAYWVIAGKNPGSEHPENAPDNAD